MSGKSLPRNLSPMLAKTGEPFDSDAHLFEIKWDGFRALAAVEQGHLRLTSRNGHDLLPRFPELETLRDLPDGCVVDGEIVIMREGRSDFHALLHRERGKPPDAESGRASFVAFDLLYSQFEPHLEEPLTHRRERLAALMAAAAPVGAVFSDGITGQGVAFFEQAKSHGLEGVMAKRLDSRYRPRFRTDAWLKIKRHQSVPCVVIGFIPEGQDDLKSLLVAADFGDGLRYVGRVGSGIGEDQRAELNERLREHPRATPLVPCPEPGEWVEPGLYALVRYLELTPAGLMRGPSLKELTFDDS